MEFRLRRHQDDDGIRRDLIEQAFRAWLRGGNVDLEPFDANEVAIFSTLLLDYQEGLDRGHHLEWPSQTTHHHASKAQCSEAAAPVAAASRSMMGPRVLVDSGANEMTQPRPEGYGIHRCRKTRVTMASGEVMEAFRTRDGELMLGDETADADAEWILSVRRLRGINGCFIWDEAGPRPRVSYFLRTE